MKVNLGCGGFALPGYINVDKHNDVAHIKADLFDCDFRDAEEIRADHLLEHLGLNDTQPFLQLCRRWLKPGGTLHLEVPDMETIMAQPTYLWPLYIYGSQEHDGEYHRSGFSAELLEHHLREARFDSIETERFLSDHPMRPGMPCLKAKAVRP